MCQHPTSTTNTNNSQVTNNDDNNDHDPNNDPKKPGEDQQNDARYGQEGGGAGGEAGGMDRQQQHEASRQTWSNKAQFVLSCIGYAVGLGNLWRFPYLCYKSGGGAFLIPYFLMLFLCGIPALLMELAVGQYTRRGPIAALGKICPLLKGAGVGTVVISFMLCTYYNVIIAWAIYYFVQSFNGELPWSSCNATWTVNCFDGYGTNVTAPNGSKSAPEEFFNEVVLEKSSGITEMGSVRLSLLLALVAAWVLVYFSLWKSIRSSGRVVYVTATVPYLLIGAFLWRALTLPGATKGLQYFFEPKWELLTHAEVWVNAAAQNFNSIGIAFGSLIAFSSYNKFTNNIVMDTWAISFTNCFTSLLAGTIVFSTLGNIAHETGKEIDDVVSEGPGLVFMVYPQALSKMPYANVWAVLFFSMLLILGLDSQFATVEVIITSMQDAFPGWIQKHLKRHEVLVLIVCFFSFLFGIPNITQGGIYFFQLIDHYAAAVSLMYLAFFEVIAIVWIYGANRLARNVKEMTGKLPSIYFRFCWYFSAPLLILAIWIFSMVDYSSPTYNKGEYIYPSWAIGLGWIIASFSIIPIPIFAVIAVVQAKGTTFWEKLQNSVQSTIEVCPCCGHALDSLDSQHTHSIGKDHVKLVMYNPQSHTDDANTNGDGCQAYHERTSQVVGVMVQPDQVNMGQGGLCGVTSPGIDSLPLMASPSFTSTSNGIANEVNESLTSLLSTEGPVDVEDLVSKLRTIINENLELKETVAQNNLALRQQLSLVVRWKQQSEAQLHEQRQHAAQAVQQLSSLQQENATLKAHVASVKLPEEGQQRFQELSDTIKLLNTRLETSERNLRLTQDEKEKITAHRSRLEGDITLIKCDLTTSRNELERLQLERFELVSAANDLRQQLRQAREGAAVKAKTPYSSPTNEGMGILPREGEVQKLQDQLRKEQDTSSTLLQELHDTRNQVEMLECEVQRAQEEASLHRELCRKLQTKAETSAVVQAAPTIAMGQAQDMQKKISGAGDAGDALEKKRLRDEAAMLKEEVETLETALAAERQKNSDERMALNRAHNEANRLKKEIQELKDRTERESHNDQYYQVKLKSMAEKHDEATAKLMSYEELLAAKNDDLSKLKKELGQTKAALTERTSESETIAILRAQVEVYQADFRAEREAREALATDREKLRDEIRHLHTRNIQLVDELEAYQRRHFQPGAIGGGGSRAASEEPVAAPPGGGMAALSQEALWEKLSNSSDKKEEEKKEEELDENLFYCPKCNKSFAKLRPLEEHVNRCLDED
ncbi:hypothetical protein Pmani_028250 [Petrolisthes manimaculis]|uniref:Transporter n=1 Tax=Petrolisthes manimaculis TaxID=1843537 RepID=A0AAE1TY81_9EUCA|nr:hypothetical protein Pmani_028250 [Petrolisthes manimaculis]